MADGRQRDLYLYKLDRQRNTQTVRQAGRQTDRQIDRQTNIRQTDRHARQTDRQADRQTGK